MKTKIVMLFEPVIVSDETIKAGDFVLKPDFTIHQMSESDMISYLDSQSKSTKKIIAVHGINTTIPQIDFNGFEKQLGFIDLNKMVEEVYPGGSYDKEMCQESFIEGYKTASKDKFSLEDLKNAIEFGRDLFLDIHNNIKHNKERKLNTPDFIDSLSKPKIFNIKIELKECFASRMHEAQGCGNGEHEPNITNNKIKITKVLEGK